MHIDKTILKRYSEGKTSNAETALVEQWFEQYEADSFQELNTTDFMFHLMTLDKNVHSIKKHKLQLWQWPIAVVALLLAILSITIIVYISKERKPLITSIEQVTAPLSENTWVILEDNSTYNLDDLLVGDTLYAEGYIMTKLETGALHYLDKSLSDKPIYHTVRTKAGGIAQIRLSDGSLVWINANSELKYPIIFGNRAREVQLKGEGYFEINPASTTQANSTFLVRGDKQTIQVLGTKFNANFTYRNETTVLEGTVKIADQGSYLEDKKEMSYAAQLYPNQVYKDLKINPTDRIEKYTDWKDGYFDLGKASLADLCRELSNWYGIKIIVSHKIKDVQLFGRINRHKKLKEVLDLIAEATGIQYELKNQIIIITNQ